jgi:DNA-binding transcriptional ArsR family regulator
MRDDGDVQVADVDVAAVARLIAEPARAAMLTVLLDAGAHPAGVLASAAGIGRPAASAHLQQLVAAGLVRVRPAGRHRYHELAGPEVAAALEALAAIAPPIPVRTLTQSNSARRLATARTCYDHLAGRAGIILRAALLDHHLLASEPLSGAAASRIEDRGPAFAVTELGAARLLDLGVRVRELPRRRAVARDCLDWTERTPHLAGALPAAALDAFIDRGWLIRRRGRHVDVPHHGWAQAQRWLGCGGGCHPHPAADR